MNAQSALHGGECGSPREEPRTVHGDTTSLPPAFHILRAAWSLDQAEQDATWPHHPMSGWEKGIHAPYNVPRHLPQ